MTEGVATSVAHVLWSLWPGGAERAVYQLVREQRRRGLRAEAVVAESPGFYGDLLLAEGVPVHVLGQGDARDRRAAAGLRDVTRSFDVVHFHAAEPLLMRAALGAPGVSLFYTHRSGVFGYPPRQRLRYALAARSVRRFSGVSANTKHAAEAAARIFRIPLDRIPVTYNGLELSLLEPRRALDDVVAELGAPAGCVVVGTTANLRDWKRVDRLLRAVAALRDEALHCVVVGDGPALPGLRALAAELAIERRVTFTGGVAHVGDYLQAFDVFVLPSGPEESFGNSVVEAMAVGLPPLVFADGGGLVEHVDDAATGFVVRDDAELVARLRELVRDGALRGRLGGAARETVTSRYSLAAMAERYERLYGIASRVAEAA